MQNETELHLKLALLSQIALSNEEQGRDAALKLWAVDDGWHGHECSAQEIHKLLVCIQLRCLRRMKRFRVNEVLSLQS